MPPAHGRLDHPGEVIAGIDPVYDTLYPDGMSSKIRHARPSSVVDTRVIYCGDNLEQLRKLPDGCVDLIYIDLPFNSNRNYEVFWGETKV